MHPTLAYSRQHKKDLDIGERMMMGRQLFRRLAPSLFHPRNKQYSSLSKRALKSPCFLSFLFFFPLSFSFLFED